MTFDPGKPVQRQKVGKSIEYWFTMLDWVRTNRTRMLKGFCGSRYGRELGFGRTSPKAMLPLLQKTGQAYSVLLAYHCPKYRMTAKSLESRGFAKRWQTGLNKRVEQVQLEKTLRLCAIDAFLLMTVMKTYRGQYPVGRVSLDNFVWDAGLGDIRRSPFYTDRYRVPLEWCRKNPLMDQSIVKKWTPVRRSEKSANSNESWQLTEGGDSDEGEFDEMVELADTYFADSSHVGTWQCQGNFELQMDDKPAMWLPWRQNEYGPFRICSFNDVPDNAIPISSAAGIYDMFCFVNVLLRKVAFRAANQKDVISFAAGQEGDARRVKTAGEIDMVQMNDPKGIAVHKMLGVDQPLWSLLLSMLTLYKQSSDTTIGNDPFAETLGQEQAVTERVERREGEVSKKWAGFLSEIGEDIADDMYDNPELTIEARRKVVGDYTVDASWLPPEQMERVGSIDRYEIRVVAGSTEYKTPQQILKGRMEKMGAMAPYIPIGMQQGVTPNIRRMVESLADLDDDDEFVEWWDYNGLPLEQAGEGEGTPKFDDGQTKEYIHKSQPSGNPGGAGGRMQQLLTQMAPQQAAMAG
jgi:hypothetical protein